MAASQLLAAFRGIGLARARLTARCLDFSRGRVSGRSQRMDEAREKTGIGAGKDK